MLLGSVCLLHALECTCASWQALMAGSGYPADDAREPVAGIVMRSGTFVGQSFGCVEAIHVETPD